MKSIETVISWNGIKNNHLLMVLIVLTLGLLNFFWGEKVPAGGGFGWDGVFYAEMVRHLDVMISGGQLSGYYAQRILPSAIVRAMLLLSGAVASDTNIIRGFELYNLTLLVGACWVWRRVANNFALSLGGRWIGFGGIFLNFESSKQAFYSPVLTDVSALFVGMLLLLFYLEKKPVALFITTIIGAFCWPVVSVSGALLLVFLGSKLPQEVIESAPSSLFIKSLKPTRLIKMGCLLIVVITALLHLLLLRFMPISQDSCSAFNSQLKMVTDSLPVNVASLVGRLLNVGNNCILERIIIAPEQFLTGLPSILGLSVALVMLVGSASFFKAVFAGLRKTPPLLVVLMIAAITIPLLVIKLVSNSNIANESSLVHLIRLMIFQAEGKFLLAVVSLVSFWGPVVLLLMIFWGKFCVQARKLGPGFVALVGISLPLGLVGEPRFMTISWPFLVLGLVLVLEKTSVKTSFKYVFAALTIMYAQFWMRLNMAPWMPPDGAGLFEFPKQLYFMHYGLWMSWPSYLAQLSFMAFGIRWLRQSYLHSKSLS